MRPLTTCFAFVLACVFPWAVAIGGSLKMDLVFVLDISGSAYDSLGIQGYSNPLDFVPGHDPKIFGLFPRLERMADRFETNGVDARYGVVVFADEAAMPHVLEDLVDPDQFRQSTIPQLRAEDFERDQWVKANAPPGSALANEEPYGALLIALNSVEDYVTAYDPPGGRLVTERLGPQPIQISYRDDATPIVILLADEPPQHVEGNVFGGGKVLEGNLGSAVFEPYLEHVAESGVIVNALVKDYLPETPFLGSSAGFYVPLAESTGGVALSSTILTDDTSGPFGETYWEDPNYNDRADAFVDHLVDVKIQEVLRSQIPEPMSVCLMAAGAIILGVSRLTIHDLRIRGTDRGWHRQS